MLAVWMLPDIYRQYGQNLPKPRHTSGFSTEVFLHHLVELNETSDLTENDLAIVDRLCKKVEVPQQLLTGYSSDLSESTDLDSVKSEYVIILTILLLELSMLHHDLKFLNCALKLLDDCLQKPTVVFPPGVHEWAATISAQLLAANV